MNKNEFMRKLKDGLVGLNQTDKREILLDYEEHFLDGIKLGRTEEEICESLGDPTELAANIKKEGKNTSGSVNDGVNTAAYIIGIIALGIGSLWLLGFAFNVVGTLFGSFIGLFAVLALPLTGSVTVIAICALVLTISVTVMIILGLIKLTILVIRWFKQMINGLTHDEDKKITREFKMFKVKGWIWITLGCIAVLAFGGILFGALNVGVNVVDAVISGDIDAFIENVEDIDIDSEEDFIRFIEQNDGFPMGLIFDQDKLDSGSFNFVRLMGWRKSVSDTQALDMTGVDTVVIKALSAGIDVNIGDEADASLTGYSRHGNEKLNITKSGSTLEIEVVHGINAFNNSWLTLDVTLPAELLDKLVVENASGSIEVNGIQAQILSVEGNSGSISIDGEGYSYTLVEVDNSSGRIEIDDISDADQVNVKNTSGSIILSNITCDRLQVKNSSGRIEGEMLEADLDVSNTSGNINLMADLGDGESVVNCTSGRIELDLNEEPMDIVASTSSGSVRVAENEMLSVTLDGGDGYVAEYTDETMDTPSIEANATSGNVVISFY